jgi:hypothetical protein
LAVEDRPLLPQRIRRGHRDAPLHHLDRIEHVRPGPPRDAMLDLAHLGRIELGPGQVAQPALAAHALGAAHRGIAQLFGLDDLVENAELEGLIHRYMATRGDQIDRSGRAEQTPPANSAARTGDDPQRHLRKAHDRRGVAHPRIASQSELQAPAQREARDGRDHRDLELFDHLDHRRELRLLEWAIELSDVGAGVEVPTRRLDDDRPESRFPPNSEKRIPQVAPHGGVPRVHGRVVEGEDGGRPHPCRMNGHPSRILSLKTCLRLPGPQRRALLHP